MFRFAAIMVTVVLAGVVPFSRSASSEHVATNATTTVPNPGESVVSLSGDESAFVEIAPIDGYFVVDITCQSHGVFVVQAVGDTGMPVTLVQSFCPYEGRVPLWDRDGIIRGFQVASPDAWTLDVRDISAIDVWPGGELQGAGADVIAYIGASRTVEYAYEGEGNFALIAYGLEGTTVLVNEIGAVSGSAELDELPVIIEVSVGPAESWWLRA